MELNYSLLFYLKKPKNYISGEIPVYMRFTVETLRSLQRSSSAYYCRFLWFAKMTNQTKNGLLAVALAIAVLWITRILVIDIQMGAYFPH